MTRTVLSIGRRFPRLPRRASGPDAARVATTGGVSADNRLSGFELLPISIELMAESEREGALDALATLYDAVGRPFQLLSVPAVRDPDEHLVAMAAKVEGRKASRAFDAYAALYRELAAAPRRQLRRTYLLLGAASEVEAQRVGEALTRSALEAGVEVRPVEPDEIGGLLPRITAAGAPLRVGPGFVSGDRLLSALVPSPRWPAQVEPGWLARLLGVEGVGAVSMRVRPLGRAEAMAFMTTRLRQVRAADRLAAERGELADVERERVGEAAMAARRSVQARRGRIYLVDTVLLVEAADAVELAVQIEALRLEGRATGLELDVATFRQADALRSILPGPAPRPLAERNLDSGSLAASLLHVASDLYESGGHLYGRARTGGEPIVLDRFAHASHNAIVLGQTGTGKTMLPEPR